MCGRDLLQESHLPAHYNYSTPRPIFLPLFCSFFHILVLARNKTARPWGPGGSFHSILRQPSRPAPLPQKFQKDRNLPDQLLPVVPDEPVGDPDGGSRGMLFCLCSWGEIGGDHSMMFWQYRVRMVATWAREAVPPGLMEPSPMPEMRPTPTAQATVSLA